MVNANKVPKIEKVSRLVRACKSDKEIIIVESLFYCALRNKELVLLKIGDFDFELNKVYVRKETAKYESKGFVPLNPIYAGHVREFIFEHGLDEDDYLLSYGKDRKPYSTRRIRAIVNEIAERAGLSNIYPHMLRYAMPVPGGFCTMGTVWIMLKDFLGIKRYLLPLTCMENMMMKSL